MNQYPNLSEDDGRGNNFNQPLIQVNLPPNPGNNYAPSPNPGNNYAPPPNPGNNYAPPPNPGNNYAPPPNPGNNYAPPPNPGNNYAPPPNPGMNYQQHNHPTYNSVNPGFSTPIPPPPPQGNNIIVISDPSRQQQFGPKITIEAPVFNSRNLPSYSVRVQCAHCQNIGYTITKEESSTAIAVWIIICLLLGLPLIFPWFFLCCLIPAYNSSKLIRHSCTRCGMFVGEYRYS